MQGAKWMMSLWKRRQKTAGSSSYLVMEQTFGEGTGDGIVSKSGK